MAGLNNAGKNALLDQFNSIAAFASLHTADPGITGTAELSGGSPAYARKAVSWAAAVNGSKATSGALSFDVPASTIGWIGYWSSGSGGTFCGSRPLDIQQTFASQGTYTIASGALVESLT